MDYQRIYNSLALEFNAKIALAVVQIVSLHLSSKIRPEHLLDAGSFLIDLKSEAKKLLWQMPDNDFELAFKLSNLCNDWQTRQQLQGLGGCVPKTFRELLTLGWNDNATH